MCYECCVMAFNLRGANHKTDSEQNQDIHIKCTEYANSKYFISIVLAELQDVYKFF